MSLSGYEILQFSLCEGWINNLYDSDDRPYIFDTLEEAIAELQEEFDEWQSEIKAGKRNLYEGYDITTFVIKDNVTDMTYDVDLVNGKIEIVCDHSNN
jgi:hypothetical protein